MTVDELFELLREAGITRSIETKLSSASVPQFERFASLVAAAERQKHQADIERWKAEAAKAEKWRGLALAKDGDGRTVQVLQAEARAEEREACAMVCSGISDAFFAKEEDDDAMCAAMDCEEAIRARGADGLGTSVIQDMEVAARQLDQALAVAAAEREACARLVLDTKEWKGGGWSCTICPTTAKNIADAIRARGNP